MAEVERTETDEELATQLLVRFKAELAALYTAPAYQAAPFVVVVGLLDVAEALIRRGVRLEPAALPTLLERIDLMRARVQAVGEPAEIPSGAGVTWH